jgi:hypothetical protein
MGRAIVPQAAGQRQAVLTRRIASTKDVTGCFASPFVLRGTFRERTKNIEHVSERESADAHRSLSALPSIGASCSIIASTRAASIAEARRMQWPSRETSAGAASCEHRYQLDLCTRQCAGRHGVVCTTLQLDAIRTVLRLAIDFDHAIREVDDPYL